MSLLKYKLIKLFSSKNILCLSANESNNSLNKITQDENSETKSHCHVKYSKTVSTTTTTTISTNRDKNKARRSKTFKDRSFRDRSSSIFSSNPLTKDESLSRICKSADQLNVIDTDDLNLNELKRFTVKKLDQTKSFENIKLKQIFHHLPIHYNHNANWMDDLSISDIKSMLWMDEFELYPLQIKKIKCILSELEHPNATQTLAIQQQHHHDTSTRQTKKTNSLLSIPIDMKLCKFCSNSAVDCLFFECGHMVACMTCSKYFKHCILCGQKIIKSIKIEK